MMEEKRLIHSDYVGGEFKSELPQSFPFMAT